MRTTNRILFGPLAVMASVLWLPGDVAQATNATFAPGDVLVSLKSGQVQWHHPDGTFNRSLVGAAAGHAEGMGFDASGNLYVTHWCADGTCLTGNTVEKFSPAAVSQGFFGSGYSCNPTSIVFGGDGSGYVGQADCTADILKLSAIGAPEASFDAVTENRGTNWIDLGADGCTILYTSEGPNVLTYNACSDTQGARFNDLPLSGGNGHAVKVLPDGTVLVAADAHIVRLDSGGAEVNTYDATAEPDLWVGVDLAGDGTSFWAANMHSGNVVRFDLASGAVLASFNASAVSLNVKGVAVVRGPSAVTQRGRMTGGGSIFTASGEIPEQGTRVTHGFELHCSPSRLPNRFEVNTHPQGQGDRFHLEEMTSASCYDDPTITPTPPAAPFDTHEGTGTGRWNGEPGATATWKLTDAGEPGTSDRWSMEVVFAGEVVLRFSNRPLTKGNHQAHK